MKRGKVQENASCFVGKGDLERSRDEQMQMAVFAVCAHLGLDSKDKRVAAGLVGLPDDQCETDLQDDNSDK